LSVAANRRVKKPAPELAPAPHSDARDDGGQTRVTASAAPSILRSKIGGTPKMRTVTRREFAVGAIAAGAAAHVPSAMARPVRARAGASSLDETLRGGIERRGIPAVAAMVARKDDVLYQGAFGTRDRDSGAAVNPDSMFAIASMTKAITSAAALQLLEQGRLSLSEPVARHLPELAQVPVLEGFDTAGRPKLRTAHKPITFHHLLTHTSGFCYDSWSAEMVRWEAAVHEVIPPTVVAPQVPLMFEPGARWQYGYSVDWVGKLIEKVSGTTLEEYFQRNLLRPLGMVDTTFIFPAAKFDRLVGNYRRQDDGSLKPDARAVPARPAAFNGGGGLYSTCADYVRFMQMVMRSGRAESGAQILRPATVRQMSTNQIGDLIAGRLKSQRLAVTRDVDLHPGAADRWGLGFLINEKPYPDGRSAGSLAWAGVFNTFYWIDPRKDLCAVIMMQFLPFVDEQAVGLLRDFERTVYASFAR
jgi:methyl acetate hydrolase